MITPRFILMIHKGVSSVLFTIIELLVYFDVVPFFIFLLISVITHEVYSITFSDLGVYNKTAREKYRTREKLNRYGVATLFSFPLKNKSAHF